MKYDNLQTREHNAGNNSISVQDINQGQEAIQGETSFFKTWWIAIRPFAFPASTMPIVFGTVLAITVGGTSFKAGLFLLSLIAIVLIHAGANIVNDICDFKNGVDKIPTPGGGAIVRHMITIRTAMVGATVLFFGGVALGIIITILVGWPILILGIVGFFIGIGYTAGPFPLKYHALGDLAVFLAFGILGSLGAWMVQTGTFSYIPIAWSVPIAMLVPAILHANNWRDRESDSDENIRTLASLLGDKLSLLYYCVLVFGPFLVILLLIITTHAMGIKPVVPFTLFLSWLSLPFAVKLMRKALARNVSGKEMDFLSLDALTAQLSLLFGVLCTAGLFADVFIDKIF